MKKQVVLDKWDSQILLLSKFHFDRELEELGKTRVDALKALWADRCGITLEYVQLSFIVGHMVDIMAELDLLGTREVTRLLQDIMQYNPNFNRYGFKREEPVELIDDIVNSLFSFISEVQVMETEDGKRIELVITEDKYTDFLKVYTREEDKEILV